MWIKTQDNELIDIGKVRSISVEECGLTFQVTAFFDIKDYVVIFASKKKYQADNILLNIEEAIVEDCQQKILYPHYHEDCGEWSLWSVCKNNERK